MAAKPELIVKIGANSSEFKKTVEDLPNTVEKSLSKLAKVGALAGAAAFAGLAAGANAAVQEFKSFEKGFSDVVTLLDQSSFKTKNLTDGIEDLKNGVLDLRAKTGQPFETLNKGLFDLVSAGIEAESAIEVLGVATDLALAGATDASTAVDGLSTAINAYGFEADQARQIAEKFFTAQKFGKTTIAELSDNFGKVGASAASLGVSFDEVLASVSAATLAGINTSEAYTGLKAVLTNIIKPSKDASEEAAALGIEFNSTALRAKGLQGFLESITTSSHFTSTSLENLFGSAEAVNIVMALAGNQADDFQNILAALGDETQTTANFQAGLSAKSETLDQKLAKLEGSAAALRAELGEKLAPAWGEVADGGINAIELLREKLPLLIDDVAELIQKIKELNFQFADFLLQLAGSDQLISDQFSKVQFPEKIKSPFEQAIDDSQKQAQKGVDLIQEALETQRKAEAEKVENVRRANLAIEEENQKAAEKEAERQDRKDEAQRERDARDAEREAQKREDQIAREDEQFEEDLARLTERLTGFEEVEKEFSGLKEIRELEELKAKARTSAQKQKIDEATAKAGIKYSELQAKATIDDLANIFDQTTAFGKALFIVQKAIAIADTIKNTQEASIKAYSSQIIPGDPSSIARAEAARLVTIAKGAAAVGVIAATAVSGAAEGGIVKGGTFGKDTEPFMLAKDEIILPSKLNPLSPNFDETFGSGGIGGGSVKVEIGLEENASKILTVKQREDKALGIQR